MNSKETYFDKLDESDLDQFRFLLSLHKASRDNTIYLEKLIPYIPKLTLSEITHYLPDLLTTTSFLNMKVAEHVTYLVIDRLCTLLRENPTQVYQLPENSNKAAFVVGLGNFTSYYLDYAYNANDVKINDVEIGNKLKENITDYLRFFTDYLTETAIATITRLINPPLPIQETHPNTAITNALNTREDYAETLSKLDDFDYEERIQILANYYDSPMYSEMKDLSELIDTSDNARYLLFHTQDVNNITIPFHALFMPGEDFYYPYFPYTAQKLSTFLPIVFTTIEQMAATPVEKLLTKMRMFRYLENMKKTVQLVTDDIIYLQENDYYKETHAMYEELLQAVLKATGYGTPLSFQQFSDNLKIQNYEFHGKNYACDTLLNEELFYHKLAGASCTLHLTHAQKTSTPYYKPTYALAGLHLELLAAYKRLQKPFTYHLFPTVDIRGIAPSITLKMLANYYQDKNIQKLTATYAAKFENCFTESLSNCLKKPEDDVRTTLFYTSVLASNLEMADRIFSKEEITVCPYKESLLSENISLQVKARICTHYALTAFTYALLLYYPSLEIVQEKNVLEKLFMNLTPENQHTILKIIVSYIH